MKDALKQDRGNVQSSPLASSDRGNVVSPLLATSVDNKDSSQAETNQATQPDNSNLRRRLSKGQVDAHVFARERSDSVLSRASSRQSRYHEDCTPRVDPLLVIGSRSRRNFIEGKQRENREHLDRRKRRPYSGGSGVMNDGARRESVVNLTYTGREEYTEEDEQDLLLQRSQSALSRVTMSTQAEDLFPRVYDVVEEDLQSISRATPW